MYIILIHVSYIVKYLPQQKILQIWTNTEFRLYIKTDQSTLKGLIIV